MRSGDLLEPCIRQQRRSLTERPFWEIFHPLLDIVIVYCFAHRRTSFTSLFALSSPCYNNYCYCTVIVAQVVLICFVEILLHDLTLLFGRLEVQSACKNLIDEVLVWLSVWSEVQMTCIGPADATATPSSLLQ